MKCMLYDTKMIIMQSIFKRSMNTKTYHGYIGSFENYYFYLTNNWFNFFLHFPFHFFLLLMMDFHIHTDYF